MPKFVPEEARNADDIVRVFNNNMRKLASVINNLDSSNFSRPGILNHKFINFSGFNTRSILNDNKTFQSTNAVKGLVVADKQSIRNDKWVTTNLDICGSGSLELDSNSTIEVLQ